MKKLLNLFFTVFLIVICTMETFSQNHKIDSLHKVLAHHSKDTSRVKILNELSWEYILAGKLDSAMSFGNKALQLSVNLSGKERSNGEKSDIKSKARTGEAVAYFNIGNVYSDQGNYPKAMENYFLALKIHEEYDDKNGIANNLSCIGTVYNFQGNYPKALEYYLKALNKNVEIGNKQKIAGNLGNLGIVYASEGNFSKALEYLFKALEASEELNIKRNIASIHGNIGLVYVTQGEYAKAMTHYFKALEIKESSNNKDGIAITLCNIGDLFVKQGKFDEAEKYLLKAYTITKEIGAFDMTRQVEESLSNLYFEKKDFKKAYIHYKNFSIAKDSIFNLEKHEDITRKEMNFEFEKKAAAAIAEQEKLAAISTAERKKETVIKYAISGGLLLMLIVSLIIFRALNITKRQKGTIESQKHLVEEKQKEILDSINYAKRLQHAILPPLNMVNEHLPESFVLYKPKDIVAGDFYWMEHMDDVTFIAAADCTGHGVPGAIISVICSNALNRTVKEFGLTDPGQILDKVRELVIETFEKSESEVKDGMDISLCSINVKTREIKWSGANNPLWYISGNDLKVIKSDKQPIGKHEFQKPFTTHSLEFKGGEILYLFTDGYADQFGGESVPLIGKKGGKKFKHAKLKELLLSIKYKSMYDQQNDLNLAFENWRGNLEQVDDVCVIGVKIQ